MYYHRIILYENTRRSSCYYVGQRKALLPLSMFLSVLSELAGLLPYILIWLIVRELLSDREFRIFTTHYFLCPLGCRNGHRRNNTLFLSIDMFSLSCIPSRVEPPKRSYVQNRKNASRLFRHKYQRTYPQNHRR